MYYKEVKTIMKVQKDIETLLNDFKTSKDEGLTTEQAKLRLKEAGYNELAKKYNTTITELLLEQINDPMIIILLICSLVSIGLGEMIDACIIIIVVVINAAIGIFQNNKAEKAIEALEKLSQPSSNVIRDGKYVQIPSRELVKGDIVELFQGQYVPADIRLIECSSLMIDEAPLTGESQSVEKSEKNIFNSSTPLAELSNMVFMSTFVTYGKAKGVVEETGMNTQMGKIAALLEKPNKELTPLQKRLAKLSKNLGFICLSVCGIMFVVGVLQGRDIFDMVLLAISLAVAAIPEGLVAVVSIVLAIGVLSMSKKNIIVKKLHAIETLGSVNVICTDKTGTLTQNKMHVRSWYHNQRMDTSSLENDFINGMLLCNDVIIQDNQYFGDPTEIALVEFFSNHGSRDQLLEDYIMAQEIPFDSNRKLMSTCFQLQNKYVSYTKGAIERILPLCNYIQVNGIKKPLDDYEKNHILNASKKMGEKALRVLALAMKTAQTIPTNLEEDLVFVGMVGMNDKPRTGVKEAIQKCHQAGINVKMITGDQIDTAFAIARELDITQNKNQVITGDEIDRMSEKHFNRIVKNLHVFARVTPEHKVKIVQALKQNNQVIAMTGDGVNDAPSLKQSNVGIAMGITGSDVSKQASDIVLSDDRFETIVEAVEEGRGIYLNIQKAILYLMSCNLGEMMCIFLGVLLMDHKTPILSAVMILWINLITDAFPALALGFDPKDQFVMQAKPRHSDESLFANGGLIFTILNGCYIGVLSLVAFRFGLNESTAHAQTMAFMVLSISQLIHALNLRSKEHSIFEVGLFKNRWLILTIVCSVTLQIMVASLSIFHYLFKTVALSLTQWGVVFGLAISVLVINEISKWFVKE